MNHQETLLRQYIKEYIKNLHEVEKQSSENPEGDKAEAPKEEEPQSNEDVIEPIVSGFVRKIKNNLGEVDNDTVHDILINILNDFVTGSDEKLNIIRNVKNTIAGY